MLSACYFHKTSQSFNLLTKLNINITLISTGYYESCYITRFNIMGEILIRFNCNSILSSLKSQDLILTVKFTKMLHYQNYSNYAIGNTNVKHQWISPKGPVFNRCLWINFFGRCAFALTIHHGEKFPWLSNSTSRLFFRSVWQLNF